MSEWEWNHILIHFSQKKRIIFEKTQKNHPKLKKNQKLWYKLNLKVYYVI